jgi:hypothetical protein
MIESDPLTSLHLSFIEARQLMSSRFPFEEISPLLDHATGFYKETAAARACLTNASADSKLS